MYNIIADTHCHTMACTHAFSTLDEMVRAAAEKELFAIGITDHARNMPGAPGIWYFESFAYLPMYIHGVRVLKGIEANIITPQGDMDCDEQLLKHLEWVVASIHGMLMNGRSSNGDYTDLWLNIAHNPNVNIIGHSGSPEFKYNYDKVIPEFGKYGKLVEINCGTFYSRSDYISNCVEIAKTCKKYGVRIVVNSDAHYMGDVKRLQRALNMLEEIDFPEELIVNSSVDRFKQYLDECNIKY